MRGRRARPAAVPPFVVRSVMARHEPAGPTARKDTLRLGPRAAGGERCRPGSAGRWRRAGARPPGQGRPAPPRTRILGGDRRGEERLEELPSAFRSVTSGSPLRFPWRRPGRGAGEIRRAVVVADDNPLRLIERRAGRRGGEVGHHVGVGPFDDHDPHAEAPVPDHVVPHVGGDARRPGSRRHPCSPVGLRCGRVHEEVVVQADALGPVLDEHVLVAGGRGENAPATP